MPPKRPSAQGITEPLRKKARLGPELQTNGQPEVVELEADETYHNTVSLHSDYNIYPVGLRKALQNAYAATIRAQMNALEAGHTPINRHIYTVISELRIRQTSGPDVRTETNVYKDNIPAFSLANTTLLEIFTKTKGENLVRPVFVELKSEDKFPNPDFTRLHCVRRNEIGWGFDVNNCLSVHLVFMENGKLNEYDIFVQRMAVKMEREV